MNGDINAIRYQDILEDQFMFCCCTTFSLKGYIFQDDNAPVHCARLTVSYKIQNHKPSLTRSITRSQYHGKFIAFHKKKTAIKEKQHKFIGKIISRNSENLDRHNTPICAKFIYLFSKKNNAGYSMKSTSN